MTSGYTGSLRSTPPAASRYVTTGHDLMWTISRETYILSAKEGENSSLFKYYQNLELKSLIPVYSTPKISEHDILSNSSKILND